MPCSHPRRLNLPGVGWWCRTCGALHHIAELYPDLYDDGLHERVARLRRAAMGFSFELRRKYLRRKRSLVAALRWLPGDGVWEGVVIEEGLPAGEDLLNALHNVLEAEDG